MTDESRSADVDIVTDGEYDIRPMPADIKTDIDVRPRPSSDAVIRASLPCATGYNNDVPTVDVSSRLQSLLDDVKRVGGGTLYLPAGRYLV